MITEFDITAEMHELNSLSKKMGREYEHRKGNDGTWGLFDVHDNSYRPVYMSKTSAGFFAYVSLLKNLYKQGKIGN
jgi:hypothetical protein